MYGVIEKTIETIVASPKRKYQKKMHEHLESIICNMKQSITTTSK
jgi:hypothetical protein